LSSSVERARLLPNNVSNRTHNIKLEVSQSARTRCRCCSHPPKSKSSSALVGNPQWTRRSVCIPIQVSPILATKPAGSFGCLCEICLYCFSLTAVMQRSFDNPPLVLNRALTGAVFFRLALHLVAREPLPIRIYECCTHSQPTTEGGHGRTGAPPLSCNGRRGSGPLHTLSRRPRFYSAQPS
jgi:hypothetical protein